MQLKSYMACLWFKKCNYMLTTSDLENPVSHVLCPQADRTRVKIVAHTDIGLQTVGEIGVWNLMLLWSGLEDMRRVEWNFAKCIFSKARAVTCSSSFLSAACQSQSEPAVQRATMCCVITLKPAHNTNRPPNTDHHSTSLLYLFITDLSNLPLFNRWSKLFPYWRGDS